MTATTGAPAAAAAGTANGPSRSWRRVWTGAGAIALALAVWEVAALAIGDSVTLPTVTETARTLAEYLRKPYPEVQGRTLLADALISTGRILAGFLFGTAAGLVLGASMAGVRVIRELADPIIAIMRPLPPIAFIPLLVVWFGIGETSKIALIFFGVLPIVTVATLALPLSLRMIRRSSSDSQIWPSSSSLNIDFSLRMIGLTTIASNSPAATFTRSLRRTRTVTGLPSAL